MHYLKHDAFSDHDFKSFSSFQSLPFLTGSGNGVDLGQLLYHLIFHYLRLDGYVFTCFFHLKIKFIF